jgi:hypothetical protein
MVWKRRLVRWLRNRGLCFWMRIEGLVFVKLKELASTQNSRHEA